MPIRSGFSCLLLGLAQYNPSLAARFGNGHVRHGAQGRQRGVAIAILFAISMNHLPELRPLRDRYVAVWAMFAAVAPLG